MEALQKDVFTREGLIDQGRFDCLSSFIICTRGLGRALFEWKTLETQKVAPERLM